MYLSLAVIVLAVLGVVVLQQNRAKEAEMIGMQERLSDTIKELQLALADKSKSAVQSSEPEHNGTKTAPKKPPNNLKSPTTVQESAVQGSPKPPTKFWINRATGLIWAGSDNGENVTWTTADKFCRELKIGDYSSGWRLPKIDELKSILDPKHDYQYTYHGQPYGGMVDGQTGVNLIKAGVELNSCCAWSGETTTDANKLQSAYYYRFQPNPRDGIRNPSIYIGTVALIRALCVHDP